MPPGLSVIRILTTDSITRDPWSSRARHCLGRIMVGQPVGLCLMLLFANRSSTLFAKRCSSVFNRLSIATKPPQPSSCKCFHIGGQQTTGAGQGLTCRERRTDSFHLQWKHFSQPSGNTFHIPIRYADCGGETSNNCIPRVHLQHS
jgi:hypothetical protein